MKTYRWLSLMGLPLLVTLACNLPLISSVDQNNDAMGTIQALASQTAGLHPPAATASAQALAGGATDTTPTDPTALAQTAGATTTAQAAEATSQAQSEAGTATTLAQAADATALAWDATSTALAIPPTQQPPPPPPPPPPPANRISFASGATSAIVEGSLKKGASIDYALRASAGQTMLVTVYSADNNVFLGVAGVSDGIPMLRTSAGQTQFRSTLPATQDYRLTLAAPYAKANYSLQVIIPARIKFQRGDISASLEGKVIAGNVNSYLIRALGGQTMSVVITSPHNDVLLTIYGFDDGIPLVRYVSGGWEWTGVLHATQDYMIEAVSVGGTTGYTLDVVIQ